MAEKKQAFGQIKAEVQKLSDKQLYNLKVFIEERLKSRSSQEPGKSSFQEMLLNGPVMSEAQIDAIHQARNEMDAWRTN